MTISDQGPADDQSLDSTTVLDATELKTPESDNQLPPINQDFDAETEPIVYGLDANPEEIEARKSLLQTLRFVIGGILAAVLIIGGLMVVKPFGSRKASSGEQSSASTKASEKQEDEDSQSKDDDESSEDGEGDKEKKDEEAQEEEKTEEAETKDEDKKESESKTEEESKSEEKPFSASDLGPTVIKDDLDKLVRYLSFDGNDLSIPDADISTNIREGRVEVVHVLHDVPNAVPEMMAGNGSRRAAALTNTLTGHMVQGTDEKDPTNFNEVIWRVVNTNGDTFIAMTYFSGHTPDKGEPMWVLMQSPYYCMSDSLYEALGKQVPQTQGETPKSLNGEAVKATASLK